MSKSPKLSKSKCLNTEQNKFDWWEEHQEVFDKLQYVLRNAPVLAFPEFSKKFELETDVSLSGLGAVLTQ